MYKLKVLQIAIGCRSKLKENYRVSWRPKAEHYNPFYCFVRRPAEISRNPQRIPRVAAGLTNWSEKLTDTIKMTKHFYRTNIYSLLYFIINKIKRSLNASFVSIFTSKIFVYTVASVSIKIDHTYILLTSPNFINSQISNLFSFYYIHWLHFNVTTFYSFNPHNELISINRRLIISISD